jgi:hypothetical protein
MWQRKTDDRVAMRGAMGDMKRILVQLSLIFILAAAGAAVWAQEPEPPQEPGTPKPAARGIPGMDDENDNQNNTNNWTPDNSPVTGLETPGRGSPVMRHSYWVPGLQYVGTIQSLPPGQASPSSWYADHYLAANLSLLQAWSNDQLALNYTGGAFLSNGGEQGNGTFQELSFANNLQWNRWLFQFTDSFSYLPQSDFGFLGGSGIGLPGVGGPLGPTNPGLNNSVSPNQSIYSANGPRYNNTSTAQATYNLTRRSSITVGGSYGYLHFTQAGNVDGDLAVGNVGYNYQLSKTDSIGVLYRFSAFHYAGQPEAMGSHVIGAAYSRKITQSMTLLLFGGPQITDFRIPISNHSSQTNASAGATLELRSANITYFYGVTNGGGALVGSLTNEVTVNLGHQLTRTWSGGVNFGFARNTNLGNLPSTTNSAAFSAGTYNEWFGGAGVNRPFGRNVTFNFGYYAQIEHATALPGCVGSCGLDYTQNVITVGLRWHTRPLILP